MSALRANRKMLHIISTPIRGLLRALGYGALGGLIIGVVVFVKFLESRPDLSVWHLAELDEEFTTESDVSDFTGYLALEERLFAQLDERVYAKVGVGPEHVINRYSRGSLADPDRWSSNWNRSFELRNDTPVAGVLLLHGLSDSPYSLRTLGERLHDAGAWVVGLRIPGHGTAPVGLVETTWQDMAAAVRLAMRHVNDAVGESPLYIIGYSNGGALAIEYTLATLDDASLPRTRGIVLVSPAIGVSGLAVLAVWQARLGHFLGLEKLAWSSIVPEYDPFKYGSFAVNAGDLVYRLTEAIQKRLNSKQRNGGLEQIPAILAFQSLVDATVSTRALVENLFARLPPTGHELVLFDINRQVGAEGLLREDPATTFKPMLMQMDRGFDLTIVTNKSDVSSQVIARTRKHGKDEIAEIALSERWPQDVFSLSHVALPFSPQDPIYGGPLAGKSPGIKLGNLALRGERGVLRITGDDILRLRWNPFHGYVESRILRFMQLPKEGVSAATSLPKAR